MCGVSHTSTRRHHSGVLCTLGTMYTVHHRHHRTVQHGLGCPKYIYQRWGPGSRWDHLLASYVTPKKRSFAFLSIIKNPNFDIIGDLPFQKQHLSIYLKLGVFKIFKNALNLLVGVTYKARRWSHLEPRPHLWEIDLSHFKPFCTGQLSAHWAKTTYFLLIQAKDCCTKVTKVQIDYKPSFNFKRCFSILVWW